MPTKLCRVLIPDSFDNAFPLGADVLSELGASLVNPATEKITSWNEEGGPVELDWRGSVKQTVRPQAGSVQFWLASDDDIFVCWTLKEPGVEFDFYLNGVRIETAKCLIAKFVEIILTRFMHAYQDETALALRFE